MGKTNKKVLIVSPYWHIHGGGERYLLEIAYALKEDYQVFLLGGTDISKRSRDIYGISLNGVEFLPYSDFSKSQFYGRYFYLRKFDYCFYMTDGSLFFPGSKSNFLIIQSPAHIPKLTISGRFKIFGWKVLCYSSFMRNIIKERIDIDAKILSPAVDVNEFSLKQRSGKEKIFLSVGRFFKSSLHDKKPEYLLNFFRRFYKQYFKGWKLVLVGNLTEKSGKEKLKFLRSSVKDIPVEIMVNLSFEKLKAVYKKSSIYWHAAGVGLDPYKFPEKMEHFGLTTLEAMAASCIPVVYRGGGQTDILRDEIDGFTWKNEEEFLANFFIRK